MAGRHVSPPPQRVRHADAELTAARISRLLRATLPERRLVRGLQLLGNR
ncbi:MAG: hypothetical protein JWO04_2264 [Gammaproteobacteria bacterium]|nr:hypothetical protein [Gammaproteobacteria bacterium]